MHFFITQIPGVINTPSSPGSDKQQQQSQPTSSAHNNTITNSTQTGNTSLTYTNSTYGFRTQYPSNWKILTRNPLGIGPRKVVEFGLASSERPYSMLGPSLDASLSISIENVSKYLDTNTLKVKTHTLQDYVVNKILEILSLSHSKSGLSLSLLKSNTTTIAGNPAWRIAYTSSYGGIPSLYETTTYVIKDNKLYTFDYSSDMLKVPETFRLLLTIHQDGMSTLQQTDLKPHLQISIQ